MNATTGFVGDATDIPIIRIAVFSGDDVVFADFAGQGYGFSEISRDISNKTKFFGKSLFVDERAIGRHLHTRINGDKISKLASESGGHTFDAISEVENTAGIVHAAGE